MKKVLISILIGFGNVVSWLFTFVCFCLAFGVIAVLLIEGIKGEGGWILGGIAAASGLYFGFKNANLTVKMGFVQYYSRVIATPEMDDPKFFEREKLKEEQKES